MAPHSSTVAWKIPWMEEPGGLQSMESLRVRHDWATSLSLSTFMHWRRKWQPTPVFLPGESHGQRSLVGCSPWGRTELDRTEATMDREAWWAAVHGVAQSWTGLKRLSSSSSSSKPLLIMLGTCYICAIDACLAPLNKVAYGSLVNSSLNFFLIFWERWLEKYLREWRLLTAWCTFFL